MPGYLQFRYLECAMTVRTDVLGARRAEQNVRPGTLKDRHAQPPQTSAAAIALIPNHQPQDADREQRKQHHGEGIGQIGPERIAPDEQEIGLGEEEAYEASNHQQE